MALKIMSIAEYDTFLVNVIDGQLYETSIIPAKKISSVPGTVIQADGALHHWGFIDSGFNAYAWGDNSAGWAGAGAPANITTPMLLLSGVVFIHCYNTGAGDGIAFIKKDGTLWLVGYLPGNPTPVNKPTQAVFPAGTFIKDVWIGGAAFALDTAGNAWSCGDPGWPVPQILGQGTDTPSTTAWTKVALPGACAAICSGTCTHFLLAGGTLYGSAKNPLMCGLPPTTGGYNKPQLLSWAAKLPAPIKQISCNSSATYAILADGSMFTWGDNSQGACGIGTELDYPSINFSWNWGDDDLPQVPVQTGIGVKWAHLKRGIGLVFHMFAEDVDGGLYSTGRNKFHTLCNGVIAANDADYSNHPNAWDVTSWTLVDPLSLKAGIPTPVPPVPLPAPVDGSTVLKCAMTQSGGNIQLSATASKPIIKWAWTVISGATPPFIGTGPNLRFSDLEPGTYKFSLSATDNAYNTYLIARSVTVAAANKPPTAVIAPIAPLVLPMNACTLDASGSSDSDGSIVAYAWKQVGGPLAAIVGSGSVVQAIVTSSGIYSFQVTVTDNQGATSSATIAVMVNSVPACPPIPAPRTITGISVTINGILIPIPLTGSKIIFSDGAVQ